MTDSSEPPACQELKSWLSTHGTGFNPNVSFSEVSSGSNIIAKDNLPTDSTIVSCPFSLVITVESSRDAVTSLLRFLDIPEWSERQWISTYLALHWMLRGRDDIDQAQRNKLQHTTYLNTLPAPDKLRTPLHFSDGELELFKGSNLYGASMDRKRDWQREWETCRNDIAKCNPARAGLYTWDMYLTAATYLSSRAFPSSLLSPNPTLVHSPTTTPILIPGVDSLNHARGQPVSWVVTYPNSDPNAPNTSDSSQKEAQISLVVHKPTAKGEEIFNNYGPKPNSEFILGYGFSIENNLDDTIVLKFGGTEGKKWEIGRDVQGAEAIWGEILSKFAEPGQEATYEDVLDAAGAFQDMIQSLLEKLPQEDDGQMSDARPEVVTMLQHYIEGQSDILSKLMAYAASKEEEGVEMARQEGVDLVLEDS